MSFAVNSCLNCSFLHLYLQFYYIAVAVTWYRVRVSKSTGRPNFIHIDHQWRRYDVLSTFKMAAAAVQYYFRFRLCWRYALPKAKIYRQTNFRRYISINGWYIATSGFGKQTPPILEFFPGCDFVHIAVIGMSFCIRVPNFIQIAPPAAEIWRHIDF